VLFYCETKPKWRKDKCIDGRKRNERIADSRDLKMKIDQESLHERKFFLVFRGGLC
jgi:hypothetical protein